MHDTNRTETHQRPRSRRSRRGRGVAWVTVGATGRRPRTPSRGTIRRPHRRLGGRGRPRQRRGAPGHLVARPVDHPRHRHRVDRSRLHRIRRRRRPAASHRRRMRRRRVVRGPRHSRRHGQPVAARRRVPGPRRQRPLATSHPIRHRHPVVATVLPRPSTSQLQPSSPSRSAPERPSTDRQPRIRVPVFRSKWLRARPAFGQPPGSVRRGASNADRSRSTGGSFDCATGLMHGP